MKKTLLITGYCFFTFHVALAQLAITYPLPRMVVQRNLQNTASLYIAGTFSIPVDRIESRLVPTSSISRIASDWTVLQERPKNGLFRGTVTASAGFFRLEVRGIRDEKVVSSAYVQSVGVGEVFIVAGQSNAMGLPNLGAKGASDRVVAFNAWNRFWNKDNALESSDKPFPTPVFSTLTATNQVFPTGETAWCWGELGDYIADRYNIPVAFFNVAIPSTVAENWRATAAGFPTKNIFNSSTWPFLQPYTNLLNTLHYYSSQFGIRAILWHHGESDAVPLHTSTDTYQQDIQFLIDKSRADFGGNMTWVVAQASITPAGPLPNPEILAAQRLLANTPKDNIWLGPDTDGIQSPRPTHGHFENFPNGVQGISDFATAWNTNLTDRFFSESQPQQPRQFIQTGLIPAGIPAGTVLNVPYETVGFQTQPPVVVQLLNEKGWFVAEVGRGQGSTAVQAYLPDTLSRGLYHLRVVATNPFLAGGVSGSFAITSPSESVNPFLDIQIEQEETTTHVHWLTAQESGNSRFFVERRDSLGTFQTIGEVDAQADGQFSHVYSFTDPSPKSGENRYRIRLEQPYGLVRYSSDNKIILASDTAPISQLLVYPNPSDGSNLTVSLPLGGAWNLTLMTTSGQTVWQQPITATANQPATVSLTPGLATGVYRLKFQKADKSFTKQLLIQR